MFDLVSTIMLIVFILMIGIMVTMFSYVITDLFMDSYPKRDYTLNTIRCDHFDQDAWLTSFCEQYGINIYRSLGGRWYEVHYSEPDELLIAESLAHPELPIPLKRTDFLVDADGTPMGAWPNPISEEQRLAYLFKE